MSNEISKTQPTPQQILASRLNSENVKKKFEEMGNSLAFSKEVAFATQAVQKNNLLMNCDPVTIITSLFNVSLTGITLNPILGYAYLIPRRNGGRFECTLDVSYKGLIQILTNSGGVKNVYAHMVYEKEKFSIEYGLEPRLIHQPITSGNKGNPIGVYGVAILSDGTKSFDYMDIEEINYIKGRSEMGKKDAGPWKTDFAEMAKKTVIKRMWKYLPKNDKLSRAAEVIAIDNENNGIDFEAEARANATKDKVDKVSKGIEDAIKISKPKAKSKAMEEKFVNIDPKLTEEQVIEHINEMHDVENLNSFIQSLDQDALTNKVFEAANKRDEELRNKIGS